MTVQELVRALVGAVDAAGFDSYFYRSMVGHQQIQTKDGGSAYKPGYPEDSYKNGGLRMYNSIGGGFRKSDW